MCQDSGLHFRLKSAKKAPYMEARNKLPLIPEGIADQMFLESNQMEFLRTVAEDMCTSNPNLLSICSIRGLLSTRGIGDEIGSYVLQGPFYIHACLARTADFRNIPRIFVEKKAMEGLFGGVSIGELRLRQIVDAMKADNPFLYKNVREFFNTLQMAGLPELGRRFAMTTLTLTYHSFASQLNRGKIEVKLHDGEKIEKARQSLMPQVSYQRARMALVDIVLDREGFIGCSLELLGKSNPDLVEIIFDGSFNFPYTREEFLLFAGLTARSLIEAFEDDGRIIPVVTRDKIRTDLEEMRQLLADSPWRAMEAMQEKQKKCLDDMNAENPDLMVAGNQLRITRVEPDVLASQAAAINGFLMPYMAFMSKLESDRLERLLYPEDSN